ncbi:MAG: cobalamin-binding protein [Pseudomonadales bacterium]|nr:cobalamin-binding protein [Pseudomonadales bacterium]
MHNYLKLFRKPKQAALFAACCICFILSIAIVPNVLASASHIAVTDSFGREIKLASPANKIISLAPHNTETLFYIGAGNRIVGTVHYSDYPEEALKIPRIGGYDKLNLEKIITLKPDLVVAWKSGNDSRGIKRIEQFGIPIFYSDDHSIQGIAETMAALGKLTGLNAQSLALKNEFLSRYQTFIAANKNKVPIKIYYEVWQSPRYTLGGTHFSAEIFKVCGGKSLFEDVMEKAPIVSLEAIIARNPQIILVGDRHGEQSLKELRNRWQQWPQIDAVKNQHIYYVDADIYTRSSPRALDAIEHLCATLDKVRPSYQ